MKKVLLGLIVLIVLVVGGLAVAVMTVDPNKYRPQIVQVIGEKTGRNVKLDGDIKLHLALDGLTFSIANAAIGNPTWASRPELASIGEFDVGVGILPLLHHELSIKSLKIAKADIQLETSTSGQQNWDFSNGTKEPAEAAQSVNGKTTTSSGAPVSIDIGSLDVENSRLAMRDKTGKTTIFTVDNLTVAHELSGFAVKMTSNFNGQAIKLDIKTGTTDLFAKVWPVKGSVSYGAYDVTADGKVDLNGKAVDFTSYKVAAGKSDIHGSVSAKWGGARPAVVASVISSHLDPADFKPAATNAKSEPAAAGQKTATVSDGRLFSAEPIDLSALKSADAKIDVKLDEVIAGTIPVKNVNGTVQLANGRLAIDFPGIQLGGGPITFKTVLDASAGTPRLDLSFSAPSIDTAELLTVMGTKPFIAAKANASMNVTSSGGSLHDLASHANGTLTIISDAGKVSTADLDQMYNGLAQLVSLGSGGSNVGLNCMATRFIIKDGVMKDNGILADTTATTVQGKGGVNLGAENLDLIFSAKPKAAKVAGKFGGLVPPVRVSGPLLQPGYGIDTSSVAQSVVGLLAGVGAGTSSVPDVVAQAGQNACVYTLDHPSAAATTTNPASAAILNKIPLSGKTGDAVKSLGGNLMKGLMGGN